MINAITVDVEDYWMNYSRDWLGHNVPASSSVVDNTERLLAKLGQYNANATFFVVGEVAQQYPDLIKKIASNGHEVASHGQHHYEITKISREQFKKEITESKKRLEDIIGSEIFGHRATSFTVTPKTKWALEELAIAGYLYDSSIFPFQGKRYGWPGFCKDVCSIKLSDNRKIIEVPMTVVDFAGKAFPACGGGYLRHFPFIYTNWAFGQAVKKRPVIVYVHPYDIDIAPPPTRQLMDIIDSAPMKMKIRHYFQVRNRKTVMGKLEKLFLKYKFVSLKKLIDTNGVRCYFEL
jgi:polysaccharide deacetylase family protein (PEP-CTERM system associated)